MKKRKQLSGLVSRHIRTYHASPYILKISDNLYRILTIKLFDSLQDQLEYGIIDELIRRMAGNLK